MQCGMNEISKVEGSKSCTFCGPYEKPNPEHTSCVSKAHYRYVAKKYDRYYDKYYEEDEDDNTLMVALIVGGCVLLFIALIIVLVCVFRKRRSK